MSEVSLTEQDWAIRHYVYHYFVEHSRPPHFTECAHNFNITAEEAQLSYERLHKGHAFFLEPGTTNIRMANPLSAIETPYQVAINNHTLWANCAWDSLGIPAMLQVDAVIRAEYAFTKEPVTYTVENGQLHAQDDVVHFLLPFREWYADLIHT